MPRKALPDPVTWLSDKISSEFAENNSLDHYRTFQFKNITASIGDFVLVSNADSAEPDTEEGCDAARIVSLYENREKKRDPFRAKVQWYSKPSDLPKWCLNGAEPIAFSERELIEDHRPFDTDVSIETFFRKCVITLTFTKMSSDEIMTNSEPYHYFCRYKLTALSKRKVNIEPVMEEERNALALLCTPRKDYVSSPQTPNSLIKRMSRVSISEHKNWSISKTDGTKLLLKRAILADKIEKESPKKATPKNPPKTSESLKSRVTTQDDVISMELEENSDDEIPTLIIRQHTPSTPKRKTPVTKSTNVTPRKTLNFDYDAPCLTRSGRVTKNPTHYYEEELSPVKRISKNNIKKRTVSEESDDDFKIVPQTPKTPKTPKTPRTPRTPRTTLLTKTPRSVKRKIMVSQLTPSLQSRAHSVENVSQFEEVNALPGREQQLEEILSFVRDKLLDGSSGCMYISGVPGTGKTATVGAALRRLREEAESGGGGSGLPEFQLIEINGMKLSEPRQAYVQIYKQLTGKSVAWEQACALLEKRFTSPGPRRAPAVLLADELDALCTRRQDVLYSILEWARGAARLAVLAVANTMDLPERALAARVASRLGLTRLSFPPYTHAQLQAIVAARLRAARVTPDAVQLIARKVAAVSGDARRALALCGRALELAGPEGAGLREVQRALAEASSSAAVRAIRACAPAERLLLRAVASEVERTGTDETTLPLALRAASALSALEGRPYRAAARARPPTPSQALAACARLSALKLLLLEHRAEPRLLLNVSTDDVHYATKEIHV